MVKKKTFDELETSIEQVVPAPKVKVAQPVKQVEVSAPKKERVFIEPTITVTDPKNNPTGTKNYGEFDNRDIDGNIIEDYSLYHVIDGEFVLKSVMKAKADKNAKEIIEGMKWRANEKRAKEEVLARGENIEE